MLNFSPKLAIFTFLIFLRHFQHFLGFVLVVLVADTSLITYSNDDTDDAIADVHGCWLSLLLLSSLLACLDNGSLHHRGLSCTWAMTCLHHRCLCCTRTCLHLRGLSCTSTLVFIILK
jgi:hypothetical protein